MFGQVVNCKQLFALLISFAVTTTASAAQTSPSSGNATRASPSAVSGSTGASTGSAPGNIGSPLLYQEPEPFASWSFDAGFIQNGARSGAMIQADAPQFGSVWLPQLGITIQSINIEGHMTDATTNSSVTRGVEFVAFTARFSNPYTRGYVRPYSIVKLGALLTGDVSKSKAVAAGYVGLGGEFLLSEMMHGLFNSHSRESSMAFFVEVGVPVTGDQVQADLMQGSPYIFNGISTMVGMKYSI